jgi:Ca-activated chloride channel family protein
MTAADSSVRGTTMYVEDPEWNTAKYDSVNENGFKAVRNEPLSTFSIDVDTASYANLRRMIRNGSRDIPTGAVRVEEILNYFKYDYPEPRENEKFSISAELTDTPWNADTKLLRVGIQAEDIDYAALPPSNLVFLLDVSGSMSPMDRLPMVQSAMKLLVENLTENDIVSIVVYASQEGVVLEGVRGDRKEQIISAIDDLMAGGSTNGGKGLETAYEMALRYFIKGGTNRIIWCTDGDLNIGITDNSSIGKMAEEYAKKDVFLSIFGVGGDNYNDSLLKEASNKGKGNYHYLDSLLEARKALVDEMGGTLVSVAKDVKIQLDFNPAYVKGYRLIGYENRLMEAKDFDDDTKAAGVLGAGHRVTALYELVLADSAMEVPGADSRYQEGGGLVASSDMLTVAVRYKEPAGDTSSLVERAVTLDEWGNPSDDQKFAGAVAMWAMLLSDSDYKGDASYGRVMVLLDDCRLDDLRSDFRQLVLESERFIG